MLEKLDLICGEALYCDVTELEAICSDVLEHHHILTNQVSRGKRSLHTKAVSMDNIPSSNSRKVIDISFKLIGSSKSKISAQKEQIEFGREMSKIKQLIRDIK